VDIFLIEFSLGSVITDTTDRYGPIITVGSVGGVGGDFSHTAHETKWQHNILFSLGRGKPLLRPLPFNLAVYSYNKTN